MDFTLRCNSLKCRAQLAERAVVTTCSHIFCTQCSDVLGLSNATGGSRLCPACGTNLPNPDDAVSTQLNPTEDYKTSVLSGLSPSIVMECTSRGLAFWSYQSTQEIVYQEYLARTLTDKYGNLSVQMDKIINDANSELESLQHKLDVMHIDQEKLKMDNANLVQAFREKSRKHQQTQELYERLKRKEMTAATQSAAFESVDEVLQSAGGRQMPANTAESYPAPQFRSNPRAPSQPPLPQFNQNYTGTERLHGHQRDGSGRMMPPPPGRPGAGYDNPTYASHNEVMATPSQHRTRLGSTIRTFGQQGAGQGPINKGFFATGGVHYQTPSQRHPLGAVNGNSVNRSGISGYGMSAGVKVGRQQGTTSKEVGTSQNGGAYYL